VRVLELFCGIGGVSAAIAESSATVVGAIDISEPATKVFAANFPHPVQVLTIESLSPADLASYRADLWWLSPPCQPYTQRGKGHDIEDPRAASLLHLIGCLPMVRPARLALENVPGFAASRAHAHLKKTLIKAGYEVVEAHLCPSALGLPNRRGRFYLLASREGIGPITETRSPRAPLASFLDPEPDPALAVDSDLVDRYEGALDIVDADDPEALTSCFTSAYGRSPVRSGSYLRTTEGLRRFSPGEILRLLGFPATFELPDTVDRELGWRLVGNSVSLPPVRAVLGSVGI